MADSPNDHVAAEVLRAKLCACDCDARVAKLSKPAAPAGVPWAGVRDALVGFVLMWLAWPCLWALLLATERCASHALCGYSLCR